MRRPFVVVPLVAAAAVLLVACAIVHPAGAAGASLPDPSSPFGFLPPYIGRIADLDFTAAHDIGVKWGRMATNAFWSGIQPDTNSATYFFAPHDTLLTQVPPDIIPLVNIDVESRTDSSAGYALPGSYLPVNPVKYQAFVRATVERYDGDGVQDVPGLQTPVRHWQVSNELSDNRTGFSSLMAMTWAAVKQACADCTVLMGGVGGLVPDGYLDHFDQVYAPILRQLNGRAMDVFDFHWYGTATGDYRRMDEVLPAMRDTLDAHGFMSVPIWITETGTYSGDPVDYGHPWPLQTEQQQAADLLKRCVHPLSRGVQHVFWAFGMVEGWHHDDSYFDHTGLIFDGQFAWDRGRGRPKIAYFTYRLMTQQLAGTTFNRTLGGLPASTWGYEFRKPDGVPVDVLWYDDFAGGGTVSFDLPLPATSAKLLDAVTDTLGNVISTDEPVVGGMLALTLGQSPVFVIPAGYTGGGEPAPAGALRLEPARPMPFRERATLSYLLPAPARVRLEVFDTAGHRVAVLVDAPQGAGPHAAAWDGRSARGGRVAPGVYLARLAAAGEVRTARLVLAR